MKWSYPFGTSDTKKRILGAQGDPQNVFDSLAGFGYSGVELFVRDPTQLDRSALREALSRSGLQVSAIGTGPMVVDDHLTLTDDDSEVRALAIQRVKAAVDLGARFGAQVNIGKLRGSLGSETQRAWGWMREGLTAIADHARAVQVFVTLEPQNSGALDNINTTEDGINFIRSIGHPNIKIMVDTYHAQLEEQWPTLSYVKAGDLLRHVHFADSERLPPGHGVVDFGLHLATLSAVKYDSFITLEIAQGDDSISTAKEAIGYLTALSF